LIVEKFNRHLLLIEYSDLINLRIIMKIGKKLVVTAIVVGVSGATLAQTSQTQYGNTIYRSDGASSTTYGNTAYGSDGSSATRYGNTIYRSNGTSSTDYGNTRYNSR
jgi:hypothetical protein